MNTIFVKHNLDNKNWSINATDLSHVFVDIFIGFESETIPILFRNLSFGINVLRAGQEFYTTAFPKPGIGYVSTDQPFVETIRLELMPNTEYHISVWCNENESLSETDYIFTTPDFVQEPFPDYEVI